MKKQTRSFLGIFAVLMLLLASSNLAAWATVSTTAVCGTLSTDTTWTLAASPYDVCGLSGVTVLAGATLTIQPGVTVQFEAGNADRLTVVGGLVALGTAAQPIVLAGVTTTQGSWAGVLVDAMVGSPASANLDYVTISDGGTSGSTGAGLSADHASVTINHSAINNSAGYGLYGTQNTQFTVKNVAFDSNAHDAVGLSSAVNDLLMTELSATNNGANAIHILGPNVAVTGDHRWANPGIPYLVDANVGNQAGDRLTIDPGTTLEFTSNGVLNIGGEFDALGTANQPIVMTGVTQAPGAWRGLKIIGGTKLALAQLDYVTLEDAGAFSVSSIEVQNGNLIVRDSIIRNSLNDGIRIDNNASGSILNSQVTGNGQYGIRNFTPTQAFLATNDWWGDAGGPQSDVAGCPSGLGDKVTAGVLYLPVLTSAGASTALPLSSYPSITLSPRTWFAVADGTQKIYFDITLHDGNGAPIPGRTVRLHSSLGTVTDGGITDALGKTLGYIVSTAPGNATVTATLDALTACEGALSPEADVTFTTAPNITDLFPNSPAPYFSGGLKVLPLPVMTGVPTTIIATLTNPLPSAITVDVSIGFVQSSIGLAFGPIKDYLAQVIPANGSLGLTATFTPVVSGHYCVNASYTITAVGGVALARPMAVDPGDPLNLNVYQSPTSSSGKNNSLDKTRNSLKNVNRFVDRTYDTGPIAVPLAVANAGISWDLNTAEKISNSLQGDPPRQDYMQIDAPHKLELAPVQPGNGISAARAAALNALDDALAQANADGTAASIALDRYGGASEAVNLQWASIQSAVMLEYNREMGLALIDAAAKIDNVIAVAASEGQSSVIITPADVVAMQTTLAASGFSAQEISDAHAVGLTDADIAAILQSILTANPEDLAGDVIVHMQAIRDQFLELGNILQNPGTFAPGFSVTGGMSPFGIGQATGNTMAQVHTNVSTFTLANPLATTTQINLTVKRLELPADWAVDVSPSQVTLNPGAQTTVTVTIAAGSPVPQGSTPRVAVEGYAGTQLLGGVVFEMVVPNYVFFDGTNFNLLKTYVPVITR
jgi:hypothetical protein